MVLASVIRPGENEHIHACSPAWQQLSSDLESSSPECVRVEQHISGPAVVAVLHHSGCRTTVPGAVSWTSAGSDGVRHPQASPSNLTAHPLPRHCSSTCDGSAGIGAACSGAPHLDTSATARRMRLEADAGKMQGEGSSHACQPAGHALGSCSVNVFTEGHRGCALIMAAALMSLGGWQRRCRPMAASAWRR